MKQAGVLAGVGAVALVGVGLAVWATMSSAPRGLETADDGARTDAEARPRAARTTEGEPATRGDAASTGRAGRADRRGLDDLPAVRGAPADADAPPRSEPAEHGIADDPMLERVAPRFHEVLSMELRPMEGNEDLPPDELDEVYAEALAEARTAVAEVATRYEEIASQAPPEVGQIALKQAGVLYEDLARKMQEMPPPPHLAGDQHAAWMERLNATAEKTRERAREYEQRADEL